MTPIKITFKAGETLVVYSEDPASFTESVSAAHTPEIREMEYDVGDIAETELQEVQLVLESGTCILCYIEKTAMAKADVITGIAECNESIAISYTKMAKEETNLDERFAAARAVINNIPDIHVRRMLHEEYLRRKSAYVSAIEALVDGVIRRPKK